MNSLAVRTLLHPRQICYPIQHLEGKLAQGLQLLLFSHLGLTAGLTILLEKVLHRRPVTAELVACHFIQVARSKVTADPSAQSPNNAASSQKMDYRLVLAASLLPDVIDKPLGLIILRSTLGSGRTIGHTLLFSIALALLGLLLLKRRGDFRLLVIAFGSTVHITLDCMWERPQTLLWPLFGFGFPPGDPEMWLQWLQKVLGYAMTHPSTYVPELAGIVICGFLVARLVRRRAIDQFVRHGFLE